MAGVHGADVERAPREGTRPTAAYRVRVEDLEGLRERLPGYAEALREAGRADADGVHWCVPLAIYREIRRQHALDLDKGCDGCGG